MKYLRSIRFRIASFSALITGVVVLVFSVFSISLVRNEYIDAIDDEMKRFGEDMVKEMADSSRFDNEELIDLFDMFDDRKSLHLIAVVSPEDKILFRSSRWRKHVLELERHQPTYFRTIVHDDNRWRYARIRDGKWQIFVGYNLEELIEVEQEIVRTFTIAYPFSLILAFFGGLLLAHRTMQPVAVMTMIAKEIGAKGLGSRIPKTRSEEDELGQLTKVLNRMFERLEVSFEQTSRFSSDASHELNTPLTIMQGELELALQRRGLHSESERLLSNLLEETQRLKTITRSLLLFSRSDAGMLIPEGTNIDLNKTMQSLLEDVQSLDAASALSFDIKLDEGLFVSADESLLRQAFYNMLANAVRYNRPNGRVSVVMRKTEDWIYCQISNTGPGISARNFERVFDRFFREDTSRSGSQKGFGLGLPLAREIFNAHGGSVLLSKSDLEETIFEVNLPASYTN